MGLAADLALFRAKLNTAVDQTMENYVGSAAVLKIADVTSRTMMIKTL